jgi:hypothetical protein
MMSPPTSIWSSAIDALQLPANQTNCRAMRCTRNPAACGMLKIFTLTILTESTERIRASMRLQKLLPTTSSFCAVFDSPQPKYVCYSRRRYKPQQVFQTVSLYSNQVPGRVSEVGNEKRDRRISPLYGVIAGQRATGTR